MSSLAAVRKGRPLVDIAGLTVGLLTVIERAPNSRCGQTMWLCLCECGQSCVKNAARLKTGKFMSCGCRRAGRVQEQNKVVRRDDVAHVFLLGKAAEGRFVLLDSVDVDLALERGPWFFGGGYARRYGWPRSLLLHRVLMGCVPGDGTEVDHVNRNRLDCRRSNLRVLDRAGNAQNLGVQQTSVTGIRGVSFAATRRSPNKYEAQVAVGGHSHRLGYFASADEAAYVVRHARARLMPYSQEALKLNKNK